MTYSGLGVKHTIKDDEVALRMCSKMILFRKSRGFRQRDIAELIGSPVTVGSIGTMESNPRALSYWRYNAVAQFMKWPLYVPGRKWDEWVKASQKPEEKKEDRQVKIDFDVIDQIPAEKINSWLQSQSSEVKSHVKILADFYSVTEHVLIMNALKEYISSPDVMTEAAAKYAQKRDAVIREALQREQYLAEQRKKTPL